jgi:predicted dehydrogenase
VPAFQQLKALLERNPVGTPWLVKLDWLMGSRADASRPWNWYSQRAAGGGVLGSLGTHAFDTLHWLLGPTRSVTASRSLAIPHRPLADGSGRLAAVDAEDIALLQLELDFSNGQRLPAQVSLAAVTRPGRGYWIEIYGSEGSLVLGSPNQADYVHGFSLQHSAAGGEPVALAADPALAFPHTWPDGRVAPVRRLIQWWAEAALEGRPMLPGLAEAALSQRVCDLALVSADTGLRQKL